jgi:UDPglucose 6-dehydrogenase
VRVVMIGTGYVGLVTGACLADAGMSVVCVDIDEAKVAKLQNGQLPIYEPGLQDVVDRSASRGRLQFTTSLRDEIRGAQAIFICVGTPPKEDGSADLAHVVSAAKEIGMYLNEYAVIVTKSTVPVGTAEIVRSTVAAELAARGVDVAFDVASNPEFLKEGAAVADFQKPDRIVVGVESERAKAVLAQVYRPFVLNGHPIQFMDIASAELTKYAANAMLAVRISFMNMMAQICERLGADISLVRQGIASDPRIGSQFLYAGIGYGGSCFPKDVRAIVKTGNEAGVDMSMLEAVESINAFQKTVFLSRLEQELGSLTGKRVAVWGLSFKPNTDDVREAPSLALISAMTERGADVVAYDPVAIEQARLYGGDDLCTFAGDAYSTLDDADVLVLATEWSEFRNADTVEMAKRMRGRLIFDGRNVLDRAELTEQGFVVHCVGRSSQR